MEPGVIRKLDEVVVNRIAAGEVIQRPANALKELLENSLDAKSTNIAVVVANGGLKLLQITDNGSGIRKEDLDIVCERFTTSKLRTFADLSNIATYGFRGEALASISHVARLSILTKTKASQCGFKSEYRDGKLVDKPRPCASNPGTQITVEDLFFNVPTRRKALRSATEEFQRISDVVAKYAIHNAGVGFSLKKQGETGNDVRTQVGADTRTNIATIYGPSTAKDLIDFETKDETLGLNAKGLMSNVNISGLSKLTLLLFINHRLVDSPAIRKSIEMVYSAFLPKGTHPFVYLSLEINPKNVDVNIHPTKHEVHFLYQDEIVEKLQQSMDSKLIGSNVSRTFYTQTQIPGASLSLDDLSTSAKKPCREEDQPKHMVRTDAKEQKMDKFLTKNIETDSGNVAVLADSSFSKDSDQTIPIRRKISLKSVNNLRDRVSEEEHPPLRDLIENHCFVGCVNRKLAVIQHQTKLYVCNTCKLSEHLFYQIFLNNFGNFGAIRLRTPAPIKELAMMALNQPEAGWRESDGEKSELADVVVNLLKEHADMLDDYFSMEIDNEGNLCTLPLLMKGFVPYLAGLPMYILRLATEVNWSEEEACFHDFAWETAKFYKIQDDSNSRYDSGQHADSDSKGKDWEYTITHEIYSTAKQLLVPPKSCIKDMTFVQVANLPDLYKVFERC